MNNIIQIHERKIPELSEKFNAGVQWLKRSLIEMKEKMRRIQHSTEISREIDRLQAKSEVPLAMSSSLASAERGMKKLTEIISDGSAVILGPSLNGKRVVVKVGRSMSVVEKANRSCVKEAELEENEGFEWREYTAICWGGCEEENAAGSEPLPAGCKVMELPMCSVSALLDQMLKIELKFSLVCTLSIIRWIDKDKIAADLKKGKVLGGKGSGSRDMGLAILCILGSEGARGAKEE
ncbi:uncharacterized protein MONOS_10937 [Monocercomonoides exilis]|uniref:uncharacterized protein n=1 Tax=Monocercomonoides exilis TaxID=2049356 RepID=UPI00355A4726|nr:hypothetical protein MONOS_10937 [Monocercomonoides exilis]|eukprot:MONOS_10937.1-p1 / transcript=MONOS_10937.1 / gene=MONOS_10937 / organism=Monocercomonoides_exilis_PA203 / gene_product=unspecified product / transcript_product=unspecified product / location=Mono_scaffold00520:14492-15374(-) / protein_length=237 / sequence_SO=supercontig / SO=protein_coding / is_pseudo=false